MPREDEATVAAMVSEFYGHTTDGIEILNIHVSA